MTRSNSQVKAYNVTFHDSFLDIQDFVTIESGSPTEAQSEFKENFFKKDRHTVEDVSLAYEFNIDEVENTFENLDSW